MLGHVCKIAYRATQKQLLKQLKIKISIFKILSILFTVSPCFYNVDEALPPSEALPPTLKNKKIFH